MLGSIEDILVNKEKPVLVDKPPDMDPNDCLEPSAIPIETNYVTGEDGYNTGFWSWGEHYRFLEAIQRGKDKDQAISKHIETRKQT